jgi:hypothetical protein
MFNRTWIIGHIKEKIYFFYSFKTLFGYFYMSRILILEAIMSSLDTVKFWDNNGHMKSGNWKKKELTKAFKKLFPQAYHKRRTLYCMYCIAPHVTLHYDYTSHY